MTLDADSDFSGNTGLTLDQIMAEAEYSPRGIAVNVPLSVPARDFPVRMLETFIKARFHHALEYNAHRKSDAAEYRVIGYGDHGRASLPLTDLVALVGYFNIHGGNDAPKEVRDLFAELIRSIQRDPKAVKVELPSQEISWAQRSELDDLRNMVGNITLDYTRTEISDSVYKPCLKTNLADFTTLQDYRASAVENGSANPKSMARPTAIHALNDIQRFDVDTFLRRIEEPHMPPPAPDGTDSQDGAPKGHGGGTTKRTGSHR